ncbi:hypothetical protein E0H75_41445 [Kribbella capetownensis]|uniref:Secreted protein n=1 Tax=Kribbella capetownensis TaxID=1572659 RepID=A0A4R0IS54_9ACTN|nr:hypothetical protein [Kribbella capetownensis]TCC35254.1 hypothetical protein E0H75_41445 [Kribbella capetownensis]
MMLTRRLGAVAAAVVTCVAFFVVAPPQASAVTYDYSMKTDDGDPGGIVKFAVDGDYVEICDIEADGWAVQVIVTQDAYGSRPALSYQMHVGGNGNCAVTSAATAGHNLYEDISAEFCVSLGKNGRYGYYVDCEPWYNGHF